MSNQLKFTYIQKYNEIVGFKLVGAMIILDSKNNFELFNFLYINKLKTKLDTIRGVIVSVTEIYNLLNLIESFDCYDKTSELLIDLAIHNENQEFPIVIESINSETVLIRCYLDNQITEQLVDKGILTALKIANISYVVDGSIDHISLSRLKINGSYDVDNILTIKLSDPSKIKMLGLKVVWRINDIEYGYPSILTEELLDTKGLVIENTNYFSTLTKEVLAKSNIVELLDYLRRIILEVENTSISYINDVSEFAQNNYESILVVTSKEMKKLWEKLTSMYSKLRILHEDEILSRDYLENDLIIIDNVNPKNINPNCVNFLSTDLNSHTLFLKHNSKYYTLIDEYGILATIKPSEFREGLAIEDYYVNGVEMFEIHRDLYTYKLKNRDSIQNKLIIYKEKYDEEKNFYGESSYTAKFSKLVEVIKDNKNVYINGDVDISSLKIICPNTNFLTALSKSQTNILYDMEKLSASESISSYNYIFIEDKQ